MCPLSHLWLSPTLSDHSFLVQQYRNVGKFSKHSEGVSSCTQGLSVFSSGKSSWSASQRLLPLMLMSPATALTVLDCSSVCWALWVPGGGACDRAHLCTHCLVWDLVCLAAVSDHPVKYTNEWSAHVGTIGTDHLTLEWFSAFQATVLSLTLHLVPDPSMYSKIQFDRVHK